MSAFWAKIVSFFMSVFTALGFITVPETPGVPYEREFSDLSPVYTELIDTGSTKYGYAQGACSDGRYIYALLNDSTQTEDSKSVIYKIDPSTNEIIGSSSELTVCFGADMAYDTLTKKIIVANNIPLRSVVTVIDAETLTQEKNIDLGFNIYGITYSETENCYYAANSGGKVITKLDSSFNKKGTICVDQADFTWQSINCDGKFIYLLGSEPNRIHVYDTKGNEYASYNLTENTNKTAATVNCGENYYVIYAASKGRLKLSKLDFSGQQEKELMQEIVAEFPVVNGYKVVQGGCRSDKYVYELMSNMTDSVTALYEIDPATWTVVRSVEGLYVDHANDMCYNSKTNELIIVNGMPNRNILTILDADTLEIKKTVKVPNELFALDYDAEHNCYYAGVTGAEKCVKYSAAFRRIDSFRISNSGHTQQTVTSDNDNLYFIFWKENAVKVYTKKGTFVTEYRLPVNYGEAENAFFIDGQMYVAYNKNDYTGCLIYKLNDFRV